MLELGFRIREVAGTNKRLAWVVLVQLMRYVHVSKFISELYLRQSTQFMGIPEWPDKVLYTMLHEVGE